VAVWCGAVREARQSDGRYEPGKRAPTGNRPASSRCSRRCIQRASRSFHRRQHVVRLNYAVAQRTGATVSRESCCMLEKVRRVVLRQQLMLCREMHGDRPVRRRAPTPSAVSDAEELPYRYCA